MSEEARMFSRYVRPIYDAIDSRQYKVAIKLAQNKKIASLDIAQILKAHCLERTGKPGEALEICRAVQKHKPTDETLLNTMGLVFRLCGHEHEMLPTYEHAATATAEPNEELFQALFVAYVRKGDFLKQQQTALKMFKAFANIKHVCWAALSMLMQVQHTSAPTKMLALADRMLLKTMRDTQSDDGEALQLLVHILQLQDKHTEALAAFDEFAPLMLEGNKKKKEEDAGHCHDHACSHSHGSTATGRAAEGEGAYEDEIELGPLQAIDRLGLEASLCKDVGQWKRGGDVYHELLTKYNADDWTYLTEFIGARVSENEGDVARVEGEIRTVLDTLVATPGNEYLRGPHLAKVHLQCEKLKHVAVKGGEAKQAVETALVDAILAYTDRFFTKTCCFSDLKQYFVVCDDPTFVSTETKATLIAKLLAMGDAAKAATNESKPNHDESTRKDALGRLHRRLLSLKSLRFLRVYADASIRDLESLAASLVAEYHANAWLNEGAKGGQREVQNTDDLLLLAAHTMLDLYQRQATGSKTGVLMDAATLLEFGLAKSAYNFQMKLLLARIYGYLAASEAMLQRHKELDVKHVQLDSLSFLVFDKLLQLCHHTEARQVSDAMRKLHRSTNADTPEYIARSYRLGVYSKVLDMTSFLRDKMQRSHALAIARGESIQFELQDALTGGPSKLAEWAASPFVTAALDELDAMLQPSVTLSRNQHREVVVSWDQQPLVATGDAFAALGQPLVECDRSAQFETSVQWIKLQLVVPKLLRVLAASKGDDGAKATALADEYVASMESLGVLGGGGVKAQLWAWSVAVVRVVAALESGEGADKLVAMISALQTPLTAIREGVVSSLTVDGSFLADGLSTAALLLRDAGLWAGALLCAATRSASKKRAGGSKKDDPVATALRGVLRGVQDALVAVDASVKAVRPVSRPLTSSEELREAERAVVENVARAQEGTQKMLGELLKNASTSIKLFLQK